MTNTDIVRALFDAYRAQDRATAEALLGDDVRFTSPQDDHIDRATYLRECFPTADRFTSQELLYVTALPGGGDVFIMYEYELVTGGRYRNTEVITVTEGRVAEIQVFFGGAV